METDIPTPILPALDEHDVIAIEGILVRTFRAQDQIIKDREEVKILNERIAHNSKIRNGAYEALKTIYGFDEPPEEDRNRWDVVRDVMGHERYGRAIELARGNGFLPLLSKMGDDQSSSDTKSEDGSSGDDAQPAVAKRAIPIRTAILEYLTARGDQGAKAGEVRQHLADAHGLTVHEKTPGMTLYRLLKEGLVRRTGRIWYVKEVIENDENEASSGISPGTPQKPR